MKKLPRIITNFSNGFVFVELVLIRSGNKTTMSKLIYKDGSYNVVGVCFEVYKNYMNEKRLGEFVRISGEEKGCHELSLISLMVAYFWGCVNS